MTIDFDCPACFRSYSVSESNAGRETRCVDCGQELQVPDPAEPELFGTRRRGGARSRGASTSGPRSQSGVRELPKRLPSPERRRKVRPSLRERHRYMESPANFNFVSFLMFGWGVLCLAIGVNNNGAPLLILPGLVLLGSVLPFRLGIGVAYWTALGASASLLTAPSGALVSALLQKPEQVKFIGFILALLATGKLILVPGILFYEEDMREWFGVDEAPTWMFGCVIGGALCLGFAIGMTCV